MTKFLDKDFLLLNETSKTLYHDFAAEMPIIDYHCHLPPADISENKKYENLTQIWLYGDHYKWRAMRTNGVEEKYCTGDASDWEKFEKWAETVPNTIRNPLYHWTHMELKKPFGIENKVLNQDTAKEIYSHCNDLLEKDDFSTQGLLKQMKVEVVCTTDDPTDTLEDHIEYSNQSNRYTLMFPTFRPDKSMALENTGEWNKWIDKLESVSDISIDDENSFLAALLSRHDFFHSHGCRLSDHGLEEPYSDEYSSSDISTIFSKARNSDKLSIIEIHQFKSFVMHEVGKFNHEKNWTMQLHLGAIRNNNTRLFKQLGADTGFDSIGDFTIAKNLSKFLDKLDTENKLPKTIIYNLNPRDNDLLATMIGNFQDGSFPGKIQLGSGWWFLDQKQGMINQMNSLSNLGLLSRFVGMLTDSRSFLSFPRHEYFRRILCNLIGTDVENGEIPDDIELLGTMVQNISYNNARNYFGFKDK
ncbi:MAG: glucuronate isomerase [Planctomycetota bacterium]|nr:MAG: glucuronate isomerase [Planctomycetota bacterium]